MKSALIGYTGFVGSNLLNQFEFEDVYNSGNIGDISGRRYSRIVCCGARAEKWLINQNPEEDWKSIQRLMKSLGSVHADEVVLISTIDVYPTLAECDEKTNVDKAGSNHPYGKHRLELEKFCRDRFAKCHIIRLPGLIGEGLKKNVVYDLIYDNCLENIQPASKFQYYNLCRLQDDIEKVVDNEIPLINLFSEPIATREIIQLARPDIIEAMESSTAKAVFYNITTTHGALWGRHDYYYKTSSEMLDEIVNFIRLRRG